MSDVEKPKDKLRTGFTTGTSAAAAAKSALLAITNQKKVETVEVLLPKEKRITIKYQVVSLILSLLGVR